MSHAPCQASNGRADVLPAEMVELIERLQTEGVTTRQQARATLKPVKAGGRGRPKHFVFRYQPKEKSFNLAGRCRSWP